MSMIAGLALGLLIMVLGAAGLTAFALVLCKRERRGRKHDDARLNHA